MSSESSEKDKRAFKNALRSAEQGQAKAQFNVGLMYANGIGVKQDYQKAMTWYRKAADKGFAPAQYLVGSKYASGQGIKADVQKAFFWYSKAAEQGEAKALFKLGQLYSLPQPELAKSHIRKAAEKGLPEAQLRLASDYRCADLWEADYPQAIFWYQKAAEQGLAEAQLALGEMLSKGLGCDANPELAKAWYKKAAEAGNKHAEQLLNPSSESTSAAELFQESAEEVPPEKQEAKPLPSAPVDSSPETRPEETPAPASTKVQANPPKASEAELSLDIPKRLQHTLEAAEHGGSEAMLALGRLCDSPQPELAVSWYQKAAGRGNAHAQLLLANHYADGSGVKKDENQALFWYQQAAQQGNADALCTLGDYYATGHILKQDYQQSFLHYQRAAEQNHAKALWNLGAMYASGRGGAPQDFRQAAIYCQQAADLGFVAAQATLANIYAITQSHENAIPWLAKAAQQGDAEAQYNLGLMYSLGQGVTQDFEQAFYWFLKAGEQGITSAQARLGLMYATAQVVPEDYIEAHKWFLLAEQGGDEAAKMNRQHSATLMTPVQIREAQRRAKAWRRSIESPDHTKPLTTTL